MNKKGLSLLLAALMVVTMLQGCAAATADDPAELGSAGDFNRWFSDGRSALTHKEAPGDYYFKLTDNITLSKMGIIDNGHKVTIDLNGFTITNKEEDAVRAFHVAEGAALTLIGGALEMTGADANGGMICVEGAGSGLTLDNVVLTNTDDSKIGADLSGGVLYVNGSDPAAPVVVTMKGNTQITGSAAGTRLSGGAVALEGSCEFYMRSGVIQNGVAGMSGNVHLGGTAKFCMIGGTITGGKAVKLTGVSGDGGNMNITAQSQLHLYGGTVAGGTAERTGGNIFVSNYGKAEKQGFYQYGGVVEGGYSATKGGNIYAVDKVSGVHLYGGEIRNGEAALGGNLYLETATLDMRGGTLTGLAEESLNTSGGNIYAVRGDIELHAGVITGACTLSSGANVYVADSTVNIYGGSITGGKMETTNVTVGGGNLFAGGESVVKMYGGTIKDGVLKGTTCRTGCVYVYGQQAGDNCSFHMYGGTLENGELEAEVMRGLAVGAYSVLADGSGIGTGRIFDGEIIFKGDSNSPNRQYTIFGNKDAAVNMFVFNKENYKGLYRRGTKAGPCDDKTHDTQVETVEATCVIPGYVQYHCDTCGDWYEITAQATGHVLDQAVVEATEDRPGYTEVHCSACQSIRYTDVIIPTEE